jgi:hypothetical protein
MAVERQLVVLRGTPELSLELHDNTEVGVDDAFGALNRFAASQVGLAFGADDLDGHFQPDRRVDAAVTAMIELVVGVEHHDVVAEELGSMSPSVGDQDLSRRQLQCELIMQELADLGLDLLGFLPGVVKSSGQSSAYADCRVMPTAA